MCSCREDRDCLTVPLQCDEAESLLAGNVHCKNKNKSQLVDKNKLSLCITKEKENERVFYDIWILILSTENDIGYSF